MLENLVKAKAAVARGCVPFLLGTRFYGSMSIAMVTVTDSGGPANNCRVSKLLQWLNP